LVSFAVLGCGRISDVHLKAIEKSQNAKLVAVCDILEEKAKEKGLAYGVPYYVDLEEMLKKQKPDVVVIGTPSGMHGEHTIMCANYGANILCEKPIEVTKEKIDNMIAVCKEKKVLLGGIFQRRMYSAAIEAKKAVSEGKIGDLILCDGYFKYHRSQKYYNSDDWRGTWALDGGGALMNQCIHGIDILLMVCGDIESVTARCSTLARDIEVEDTAVALVKYKNGAVGVIEGTTALSDGFDTVFQIHGKQGNISFGDGCFYSWDVKGQTAPEILDSLGGKNCGWQNSYNGHTFLVDDMAHCVMEGKAPYIPGEEARKAVDVILAIYKSSKYNKEIKVYD